MSKLPSYLRLLLYLLGGIILLVLGVWSQDHSFEAIHKMRQMERVPNVLTQHVVPVEVSILGKAEKSKNNEWLVSKYTKTNCLYYRYLKEKEKRDSDGDKKWVTVEKGSRFANFFLADQSGHVLVDIERGGVRPSLKKDYEHEQGRYRYSEWRIDEGEELFAMAMGNKSKQTYSLRFDLPGAYVPIISNDDGLENRSNFGNKGILLSALGVSLLCFGCLLLCFVFRVHRVLLFLIIVSFASCGVMIYTGCKMLKTDLEEGYNRLARTEKIYRNEISEIIGTTFEWEDITEKVEVLNSIKKSRALGITEDFIASIERTNAILNRFPENILAPIWGIKVWPSNAKISNALIKDSIIKETPIPWWSALIWASISLITLLIGLYYGFRKIKLKRYIENIPTSPSAGLAYGPAEIKGKVEFSENSFLKAPETGTKCIYFRHKITKKVRSGKKTKVVVVKDQAQNVSFFCKDSEGRTKVEPEGAEINSALKLKRKSGRKTYYEWHIAEDASIYLLGSAIVDEEVGDSLIMAKGKDKFPFILSDETETEVMLRQSKAGLFGIGLAQNGFVSLMLSILGSIGSFAASDFLFCALFSPAFLVLCMVALMYNDLIFLRNRVKRAWANIEVALKKRSDLIPNLEKIVKGYLSHEQTTLESLSRLRNSLIGKSSYSPSEVDNVMKEESALTGRLLAIRESNPELKGNQMMNNFMDSLTKMENEVAFMRAGYNDGIERYLTVKNRIPEVLIAKAFQFEDMTNLKFSMKIQHLPAMDLRSKSEEVVADDLIEDLSENVPLETKLNTHLQTYIYKDGQQYGPYTIDQIKSFVAKGNFSLTDHACWDGENWKTISDIPSFSG